MEKEIKIPPPNNLETIILACGDDFRDLTYHSPRTSEPNSRRWIAKGGKRRLGHWKLFNGKTPNEAVYKMLLEFNKLDTCNPHLTHNEVKEK